MIELFLIVFISVMAYLILDTPTGRCSDPTCSCDGSGSPIISRTRFGH